MLFNSMDFMIFFPIVVFIYFLIPDRVKYLWLLGASYYFYMCWNAKYALLLLGCTVGTYVCSLLLEAAKRSSYPDKKKTFLKKLCLGTCIVLNLMILAYFKYANFGLEMLQKLFAAIHIQLNIPAVDVVLPVGISFFTFQALSYTIDVYRGDIYAEKNFFRYALFVSFFPQLVAGPIERSKNLLRQLAEPKKFSYENAREGLLLMIWGFFLKMVLADRVAIFVDTVYGDIASFGGWYLIVATVLFAVQIYCDFAGYSIIAMGVAKVMSIELMENFRAPYLATSVAEFWRNWHISLTSWFKDYLYIPLGGSRKGTLRKHINRVIVFLVSGLWHGAELSFVVWGGLNGLYQVAGDILKPVRDRCVRVLGLHRESIGHKLLAMATTFVLVDIAWIFFRAANIGDAIAVFGSILRANNPWILFDGSIYNCGLDQKNFDLALISIGILIFADICKKRGIKVRQVILKQDFWVRWLVIAVSICAILLLGIWGPAYDAANFIYFQF